jgi:hypothetical protein
MLPQPAQCFKRQARLFDYRKLRRPRFGHPRRQQRGAVTLLDYEVSAAAML